MRVDPIKPMLKAPGTKRLKPGCDNLLSTFAFNFELAPLHQGSGHRQHRLPHQGWAVQLDPIKPTFKAPGIKLLELQYDELVSNFAFKLILRRYIKVSNDKQTFHDAAYVVFKYEVRRCMLNR